MIDHDLSPPSGPVRREPLFSPRLRMWLSCYGLLLIPVGLLVTFIYLPVFWAFSKSVVEFEIGSPEKLVGLRHYQEFLSSDPTTVVSFFNMFFLVAFAVAVRLSFPLLVAKLIHSLPLERSRYIYRLMFLVPIVVPGVALQLLWRDLVFGDTGLVNEALRAIGFEAWARAWLADPRTALVAIAFVGFPWVGGFEVLIYYAGLANIPESVNEAAELEGCTGVRKFFLIDIPMVLSQLKLILILTLIMGIQGFENVLILTEGRPGFETMVPGLWMYYNAFSFQRFGYACAIGVLLFGIIFLLTFINFRYFKSSEEVQAQA